MVILGLQKETTVRTPERRDKMLQFIKAKMMFPAAVTAGIVLSLALCYGVTVRDVFSIYLGAVILFGGSLVLFGIMVYSMISSARKLRRQS